MSGLDFAAQAAAIRGFNPYTDVFIASCCPLMPINATQHAAQAPYDTAAAPGRGPQRAGRTYDAVATGPRDYAVTAASATRASYQAHAQLSGKDPASRVFLQVANPHWVTPTIDLYV